MKKDMFAESCLQTKIKIMHFTYMGNKRREREREREREEKSTYQSEFKFPKRLCGKSKIIMEGKSNFEHKC